MGDKEMQMHSLLEENYPDAEHYLDYSNPVELVVAAIVSPQTKDEVTNAVTPGLFAKYSTAQEYAEADVEDIQEEIKKVSFSARKAKNIKEVCRAIYEDYNDRVPDDVDELVKLPGIGRKTANSIVINAYDIISGVVVDSHVARVAPRMGFSDSSNPDKVERDLMDLFPQDKWKQLPWIVKKHGRAVCKPTPLCSSCFLNDLCPKDGVTKSK